jgi:hypothetical protein
MTTQRVLVAAGLCLALAACSGAPIQPALTSFTDIPVPEGMAYQPDRSGVVDGPTIKAARLVYKGRLEVESLSASMRQGLEQNGWKHVRTATAANRSINMVFEKPGADLQLTVWEGSWNTFLDITVGRVSSR